MNIFLQSYGLLNDNDFISLSDGIVLQDNLLIDTARGLKYKITTRSKNVLKILSEEIKVVDWLEETSNIYSHNIELLQFIDSIDALKISRNGISKIQFVFKNIYHSVENIKLQALSRRFRGSILGLAYAYIRATYKYFVLSNMLLLYLLNIGALNVNFIKNFYYLYFVNLIALSTHFYVHILFAKTTYFEPVILQKGLSIKILHRKLKDRTKLYSAIISPSLGVFAGLIASYGIYRITDNVAISVICALSSTLQLISLSSFMNDGNIFRKNMKKRRVHNKRLLSV